MSKRPMPMIIQADKGLELLNSFKEYLYNSPIDENTRLHYEEIPLLKYALESYQISDWTALHKVLFDLAYLDYFLYLYDDVDWVDEPAEFTNYALEMFNAMSISAPADFLTADHQKIISGRHNHTNLFLEGLKVFVHNAMALAWPQKALLFDFNMKMGKLIAPLQQVDYPQELEANGKIRRAKYYPVWLVNLVQHRDRGICQHCGLPVNPVFAPGAEKHMDHMVPLAVGGTNDATNFILACGECNLKKGGNPVRVHDKFYWPGIGGSI